MIFQLTENVYFGNWTAPFDAVEKGLKLGGIINVAHRFSERRGRNYWERMKEVPHDVPYLRAALPDKSPVTEDYLEIISTFVESVTCRGPILTHCQMGGHRGPAAGIFVAWLLENCTRFEELNIEALRLRPRLANTLNGRAKYYESMLEYCRSCENTLKQVKQAIR